MATIKTTLIKNVTTAEDRKVDILVSDGKIEKMLPAGEILLKLQDGAEVVDGTDYVVVPGFVDAHSHPDKTLLGMDWYVNDVANNVAARVKNEREKRLRMGLDPYRQASRLTEMAITKGTTAARNHVDVDTVVGLAGIDALLQVKEDYKEKMSMELVAFPQSGLVVRPGTYELMEQALEMGADLVGGIDPANMDRDPAGGVKAIFDLAEKYDKRIDIHLHEPSDLGAFTMSLICERTKASGMEGRVTISHAFCLGSGNETLTNVCLERLADAKIHLTTGGQPFIPNIPPITKVMDAGLLIAGGNDGVRDMWGPFGTCDMAERVQLIAMRNQLRTDADIRKMLGVCTTNGAKLLELENYGLEEGKSADFVLIKARNVVEAVVTCPKERMVYKNGKLLAKDGALTA